MSSSKKAVEVGHVELLSNYIFGISNAYLGNEIKTEAMIWSKKQLILDM
jgi:hypothetical protein